MAAALTPVDHRVEIADGVATITLARPHAYNALTADLMESLLATFRALARDAAVRALVLTGEGKGFCAGQALDDERTLPKDGPIDIGATVEARYSPLILAVMTLEKPVVAAVNGVAAGAGMGIACACDFRIVADTASFTTAFAKIGLVPDSALSFTLPRLIGYARALELCMLSEKVDAARADALGLCTKVVPADRCLPEAQALATALARGPKSLGLIKRELLRNGLGDLQGALAYEGHLQSVAGRDGRLRRRHRGVREQARAGLPRRVSVAIRRATPDDAALLADHRAKNWYQHGDRDDAEIAAHVPVWEAWMLDALARETYVAFIASDGAEPLGSAALLVHEAIPRPGYRGDRDGRVHSVYVLPDARRRGIARALMQMLLAYSRDADIMRLTLHPTDMSRGLYAALGFEPLDEMGLYFRP